VANGVTWTVIDNVMDSTVAERAEKFVNPGLRGGLPLKDYDVDLLGLWMLLYPGDMQSDLDKMNAAGLMKKVTWRQITPREYTVFWGLVIAGSQYHQQGKHLWDEAPRRGVREPPSFASWMKHWRFEEIRQLVKYAKADLSKVQADQWSWFRQAVTDFNANRKAVLQPGLVAVMDESMSSWKPRADKLGGLPNISFIMRKPKPLGTEFKTAVDADTGMMTYMEIQEGRDPMRCKDHAAELGVTSACVLRAATTAFQPGATICGDSWFSSVKVSCCTPFQLLITAEPHLLYVHAQTAAAISKAGYHYVGALKTASACFPKAYLQGVLQPLPAGSQLVTEGTYQDVPLLAIGYKYNRRKVLFFVATRGAGTTTPGDPYVQRWADDHGNLCVRQIPRPTILSEYFSASNAVDLHNQSRQADLGLEERWQTKDCWFRLLTTLFGIVVTDCWKAVRHHVGKHHRLHNNTVMDFANELAYALPTNGLRDQETPSRASERLAMADATNSPNVVANAHLPVQYPKA
jgi:hypothetical protein